MMKNELKHVDRVNTIGVLLTNLGTPAKPTYFSVLRYLQEFLSDKRVIEIPRAIWWLILYGFILPLRPLVVAKKYASIWLKGGSPLLVHSQALVDALERKYAGTAIHVKLGMRYGKPSIQTAMAEFKQENIAKLIVIPLYPQYSATTTGSTFDSISYQLAQWRYIPALRFVNGYADFAPYITAISDSIIAYWKNNGRGEKLLISFHGLPKQNLKKGDPYYCFCHKTARLIAEHLALDKSQWQMVFQSRFGKAQWLEPYCNQTLANLASQGIKTVDVVCPGFPVDCLETLEEISETYAEAFIAAGGKKLNYIPALNSTPQHVEMLHRLIEEQHD